MRTTWLIQSVPVSTLLRFLYTPSHTPFLSHQFVQTQCQSPPSQNTTFNLLPHQNMLLSHPTKFVLYYFSFIPKKALHHLRRMYRWIIKRRSPRRVGVRRYRGMLQSKAIAIWSKEETSCCMYRSYGIPYRFLLVSDFARFTISCLASADYWSVLQHTVLARRYVTLFQCMFVNRCPMH